MDGMKYMNKDGMKYMNNMHVPRATPTWLYGHVTLHMYR